MARENNPPEEHDPSLGPAVTAVHVGGESIVDRLLPHAKKIGMMLLGAALLVTVAVAYRCNQRKKAERSTTQVVRALDLVERRVFYVDNDLPELPPPADEVVYKSDAERIVIGEAYFNQQFSYKDITEVKLDITVEKTSVTATANLQMPTALLKLAGIDSMDIVGMSEASRPAAGKAEVVLVLDYSGSMKDNNKYKRMASAA